MPSTPNGKPDIREAEQHQEKVDGVRLSAAMLSSAGSGLVLFAGLRFACKTAWLQLKYPALSPALVRTYVILLLLLHLVGFGLVCSDRIAEGKPFELSLLWSPVLLIRELSGVKS